MKTATILFLLTCFCASLAAQTMPADADPKLWAQALKIHRKAIIVDGHNEIFS